MNRAPARRPVAWGMTQPDAPSPGPNATPVRERFTPEEWFKVMNGPGRAGLAVIAAGPSGVTGLVAETAAVAQTLQEMIKDAHPTPLLAAMAVAFQQTPPEELRELRAREDQPRARGFDEIRAQALEGVRQAMWLVKAKTSPEDAAAYGRLLLDVGRRVAEAAKEGGFLGIGGVQVSDGEKTALEELRALVQ